MAKGGAPYSDEITLTKYLKTYRAAAIRPNIRDQQCQEGKAGKSGNGSF